ncbi:MAG: energy transducer TonB [Flavobacterium sp.]
MPNVSIYEKNWTDLVFEHRNKEYGAYQLRQESQKTTMLAFLMGLLFFFSLIGSWMLLSSFDGKTEDGITELDTNKRIIPVDLTPKHQEEPLKPKAPETPQTQPLAPVIPTSFTSMVVAATPEAQVDVPTNDNLANRPIDTQGSATGGIEGPASDSGTPAGTAIAPDVVRTTVELDRLPEYPGGIKKFYEYVGNSIDKSEIDENSSSVSVIMGFVIEKDGTMSNIRCLRSSDKNLEKEAIRVLKSLKIKWSPGYLDGEKVRTQYTLPIKVAI